MSRGKGKKTQELLGAAEEILEEIQPAHVRAVCYRLFVAGLIPNMSKAATSAVSRHLRIAREEGGIPWEWIVDDSRKPERISTWRDPDHIISAATNTYRRNNWQDQPRRVEIWSEKGTVVGTLNPILDKYGVTLRVHHGFSSATVVHDVAESSTLDDKPLVALYVGDFDPAGMYMNEEDLPSRLARYGGHVELVRVALLEHDRHTLPTFPAKRTDTRYKWFKARYGTKACELDALPPPQLRERVEKQIRACLNLRLWAGAQRQEKMEVDSMKLLPKAWQAARKRRAI